MLNVKNKSSMKESKSQDIYCDIDISKASFDICYDGESFVFVNRIKGFKGLMKVMEKVRIVLWKLLALTT